MKSKNIYDLTKICKRYSSAPRKFKPRNALFGPYCNLPPLVFLLAQLLGQLSPERCLAQTTQGPMPFCCLSPRSHASACLADNKSLPCDWLFPRRARIGPHLRRASGLLAAQHLVDSQNGNRSCSETPPPTDHSLPSTKPLPSPIH